jgi:hypothetical protein
MPSDVHRVCWLCWSDISAVRNDVSLNPIYMVPGAVGGNAMASDYEINLERDIRSSPTNEHHHHTTLMTDIDDGQTPHDQLKQGPRFYIHQ